MFEILINIYKGEIFYFMLYYRMEDLFNVLEVLYVRLCCNKSIGIVREVIIRRELMDMDELI